MIDDPVKLRHVTLWSRSPALELSMLLEGPGPTGPQFLAVASDRLDFRGFWKHPRNVRGEPNTTHFPTEDDYPVLGLLPLTTGGHVGLNVIPIDPALDCEGYSELLFYIPYDIVEMAWNLEFFQSSMDEHAVALRELAGWLLGLRTAFRIHAAWIGYEGMFRGWAEVEVADQGGIWMQRHFADALDWSGEDVEPNDRIVPWAHAVGSIASSG